MKIQIVIEYGDHQWHSIREGADEETSVQMAMARVGEHMAQGPDVITKQGLKVRSLGVAVSQMAAATLVFMHGDEERKRRAFGIRDVAVFIEKHGLSMFVKAVK